MDEAFMLRKHSDWFGLIAIDLSDIEHYEQSGAPGRSGLLSLERFDFPVEDLPLASKLG
jgi:hypothetical protein